MCRVTVADRDRSLTVDRRTVLRGGVALGAGAVLVGAAAACDSGPTPAQITAGALLPLAQSALADAEAARALAPRVADYAAALRVVADQRADHATELRAEITRLDQDTAARISPAASSTTSAPATSPAPAPTTGTLDELRSALTAAARTAHDTAISLKGYSAGLSGSVGASVTTLVQVQLG
ncbi:hypothetical protein [Gordonia sp. NPDC003429]